MKHYKVLFCDLDGTLIDTLSGETFPKGIWDMKLKFDVLDAINKLKPEYIFIVSNQGGIEKGFVDGTHFAMKSEYILGCICEYCNIDYYTNIDYNYCDTNDVSNIERKPNTGMLKQFYNKYVFANGYNKEDCLMIGDASGLEGQFSDSDKKCAENFGIDYLDVNEFIKQYNN